MSRPFLALMYHRINTLKPDPWTTCVSPVNFEQHLEAMRSLPAEIAVTFDDGYADNFQNAKPLLEKYDKPATVFVTSGAIDSPYEMWWDELDRKFLGGTSGNWDWDDPPPDAGAASYRNAYFAARAGQYQVFEKRPTARPERRMMTRAEVAELAATGLITIGAHSVTHPVLSGLSVERQHWEVAKSKSDLEEIAGKPVCSFAYPNGGRADYTSDTIQIVKETGFLCAFAAWEASVAFVYDRFQIPRVMVRDWDGDTFAAMLHSKLSE